ncbi:MAG: heavy-metal-associated domain-containing protein [Candidatus Thermoplasmatota archaeon]|jgi:copper chaperone CopZ|nr:heavy-metal-associated domain-containing protein [Candidatus Thermoplasmatota archaeon]MCL5681234.1 heavy-metal-associated domain-containing protein [Candidatus Thermoplasmatota archaeon]
MGEGRVKLRIYGMTCDDCVATVTRGLMDQDGVLDVRVSLEKRMGEVDIDPEKVKPEELLSNKVFKKPSHYTATLIDQ